MKALEDREWLAHPSDQDDTGKKTVPFADVINKLVETRKKENEEIKKAHQKNKSKIAKPTINPRFKR